MSWIKWKPTSPGQLELVEQRLLSYIKTPYEGFYVDISDENSKEKHKIWTVKVKPEKHGQKRNSRDETVNVDHQDKMPIVLIHGFAAGVGIWSMNLDALAKNRTVYAFDVVGFGRSSRPSFNLSTPEDVEWQIVQCIDKWREAVGLNNKFILLGHSFGAYIASSYALQFPDHVGHLVLADPWGVPSYQTGPQGPNQGKLAIPVWIKLIATVVFQTFTPLAVLRAAGPWGPAIVQKLRPDIKRKFEALTGEEDSELILDYIYHLNAQDCPAGEQAFKALALPTGWAKFPIIQRIVELHADIDLTFLYGSRSWIDRQPAFQIKYLLRDRSVDIHVIQGSGHHVYADKAEEFNDLVNTACLGADEKIYQIELEDRLRAENLHEQD
ncbi:(Lyso)-N-acylphosphatidylethanolamine lipase [Halotydeus destructor]|nr:(Lyso)-N-acylphosphatidylethanolamine lipase [Halotydeus destructor]